MCLYLGQMKGRGRSADISAAASVVVVLVVLIAVIGGVGIVENVHAVQQQNAESATAVQTSITSSSLSAPLPSSTTMTTSKSSSASSTSSASGSGITVSIQAGSGANTTSIYYSPPLFTVVIGVNNSVTWVNNDVAPHTVTSNAAGVFNSGNMNPGASWSYTFTQPGTYEYHCSYHSWMHGTVIVVKQG